MTVRPLDLRDLPHLYHFRDEVVSLDTVRTLTRGHPLGASGLLAYINPVRHIYSAIADSEDRCLMGGITQARGESFAKLLYLAPATHLDHPELPALMENLSAEAGSWGAFHILAEVGETHEAFVALRSAGYSVYAWQRMWDVSTVSPVSASSSWKRVTSVDLPAVQTLYHQIVPPLLQPLEPLPQRQIGLICNEGVKCYVGLSTGLAGIVLTPLIHPEATQVSAKLTSLIHNLPNRGGRQVYLCVRSYQAWLEPVLEDLGAHTSERQAVMVKHLTRLVKDEQMVKAVQPATVSVQPSRVSGMQKQERLKS